MRVGTWNVHLHNISRRHYFLDYITKHTHMDIIALTETWFTDNRGELETLDTLKNLGFNNRKFFGKTRTGGATVHGGVAILVKDSVGQIEEITITNEMYRGPLEDTVWIKIDNGEQELIFGNVYLPKTRGRIADKIKAQQHVQELLCNLQIRYKCPLIVAGDWNAHVGPIPQRLQNWELQPEDLRDSQLIPRQILGPTNSQGRALTQQIDAINMVITAGLMGPARRHSYVLGHHQRQPSSWS